MGLQLLTAVQLTAAAMDRGELAGLATEDVAEAQSKGALHLYAWFAARGTFVWAVSTLVLRLLPSAWVDRPAWTLLITGLI
ncbi:MAG: hypothetical protein ACREEO_15150, partial [Phenylobacterium sp.]